MAQLKSTQLQQQTTAAPSPAKRLNATINSAIWKEQLKKALQKGLDVDQYIHVALLAVKSSRDNKLKTADPTTVCLAVSQAGQLGLSLDPLAGEAYLVARNAGGDAPVASLMLGYRGLMKLARQSGDIATFEACVVHEGDTFDVVLGSDPSIRHVPELNGDREPAVKCAYAIARFKDGTHQIHVSPLWQINAAKGKSASGNNGPWKTDFSAMAQKTALRRLLKMLPMGEDLTAALSREDAAESGETIIGDGPLDVEAEEVGTVEQLDADAKSG